tara:strand:- start:1589 stop:1723 length:135 start_codon:yes stop_codon:yes gene_type:complete
MIALILIGLMTVGQVALAVLLFHQLFVREETKWQEMWEYPLFNN